MTNVPAPKCEQNERVRLTRIPSGCVSGRVSVPGTTISRMNDVNVRSSISLFVVHHAVMASLSLFRPSPTRGSTLGTRLAMRVRPPPSICTRSSRRCQRCPPHRLQPPLIIPTMGRTVVWSTGIWAERCWELHEPVQFLAVEDKMELAGGERDLHRRKGSRG